MELTGIETWELGVWPTLISIGPCWNKGWDLAHYDSILFQHRHLWDQFCQEDVTSQCPKVASGSWLQLPVSRPKVAPKATQRRIGGSLTTTWAPRKDRKDRQTFPFRIANEGLCPACPAWKLKSSFECIDLLQFARKISDKPDCLTL